MVRTREAIINAFTQLLDERRFTIISRIFRHWWIK